MTSLISELSKSEQKELFENIYYLHTEEIHSFCDNHKIPYKIFIETKDGKIKSTQDKDRKAIVINRVKHYLKSGKILSATLFKKDIVELGGLPKAPTEIDRLYYGCYEKKNPKMIELLRSLTDGEFKNGAIARILLRKLWTSGEAPTFTKFAKEWLKAKSDYSIKQHPEAAYLNDLSKGKADANWKEIRIKKAEKVLKQLGKIPIVK